MPLGKKTNYTQYQRIISICKLHLSILVTITSTWLRGRLSNHVHVSHAMWAQIRPEAFKICGSQCQG